MARDNRIDTLKGFLIILVVLGHFITSMNNVNIVNHAVMGMIYIFHMPLFILISGYFTKSPEQQSAREMWRGILNLAITLVIFQLLNGLWVIYAGRDFIEAMKAFPYGVLWYLLSLIYWRIILFYTPKSLFRRPWLYLGIALALSIFSGFTHLGKFLSLQRTLNFFIFFLLGFYYRQGVLDTRWWKNNKLHAVTAVVLLPIIFVLYPRCGNFMNGADRYTWSDLPEKIIILTCSISVSLFVFNIVKDWKPLRPIGKDSLFYYMYHMFIISMVFIPLVRNLGWPSTFPFIVLYTAITLAILIGMSKIPLFRWLLHPTFKKRPRKNKASD